MMPGETHKHPHLSGTTHAVQTDLLDLFLRVEKKFYIINIILYYKL